MKRNILSLAALFTVAIASAQSYPKQPDPSVVTYIEYKKVAKAQNDTIAKPEVIITSQDEGNKLEQASIQPATSVNTNNTVTENNRNNKARKE
jgi:hypothetical protein